MKYTILFLFIPVLLFAQPDTVRQQTSDVSLELIEDFLQSTEGEGNFDFNTIFEQLEIFRRHPIHLNKADEAQLQDLQLLSDAQILNFLQYRQSAGELISLEELQAIPGFDLPTINRILPFVTLNAELDDYQIPLGQLFSQGSNDLYLRWSRIVEEQKGFSPSEPGSSASRYLGDPNQLYLRFKHAYSNKFSLGLTAEKDRGEEFFEGSNSQGFDYYSAHLFLRDYNRTIRALALGDYTISFGQGLILYSGFGYGKGSSTLSIKRTGRTIRPYTSVNEVNFMRGASVTLGIGPRLQVTPFVSFQKRDGNLALPDTSDLDPDVITFTSLDLDGLHRTPSEIADERVIGQFTSGGSLKYQHDSWHVALNVLYDQFDKTLQRRLQPYNRFYFTGDRLLNASIDYSWVFQNFNFFGETAWSDNGAVATTNGLLIGLDRKVDLSLLFRHFPRDYTALNANPFGEASGGLNETGFYTGVEIRPIKNWTINAYFDLYEHPWLRYQVDAPSRGFDYRVRLTYYLKRKLRAYFEIREEIKSINAPENTTNLNYLIPSRLFQTRLHIGHELSGALELRTRVDWGFTENDVDGRSSGFVVLQDVLFKPLQFPLSFTARFALFDTDGYAIRFYHFENDLLYAFSIPAYYNRGSRFYLNARYRPVSNLTLEFRFAQTYWSDQKTIGSSLDEIDGNVRTQLGAQMKISF